MAKKKSANSIFDTRSKRANESSKTKSTAKSVIQSVLFNKKHYTIPSSRKWLREHDMKENKVHITDENYRWRQVEPNPRKKYRIGKINKGIKFVYMF